MQRWTKQFFTWLAKEESGKPLFKLSVALLCIALVVNSLMLPFTPPVEIPDLTFGQLMLLLLILIPTLPLEELIFRGPITWFAQKEPGNIRLLFMVALLFDVLFALLHHGGNLMTLPMQGVTGLMLALIYLKSGGAQGKFKKPFLTASLAHIGFNLGLIPVAIIGGLLEMLLT